MSNWVEVHSGNYEGRTVVVEKYTASDNDYKVRTTLASDENGQVEIDNSTMIVANPRQRGASVSYDYEGLDSLERGLTDDFDFKSTTAAIIKSSIK